MITDTLLTEGFIFLTSFTIIHLLSEVSPSVKYVNTPPVRPSSPTWVPKTYLSEGTGYQYVCVNKPDVLYLIKLVLNKET